MKEGVCALPDSDNDRSADAGPPTGDERSDHRTPSSSRVRWRPSRWAVKLLLIWGGLTVAFIAMMMGNAGVWVNGVRCGTVFESSIHSGIQRATAMLGGPSVDPETMAACASARLQRQILVYGVAQLALIAAAVGMLLRRDPSAPLSEDLDIRWMYVVVRSVAVLVPSLLLVFTAKDLLALRPEPEDRIELESVEGEYRHAVPACSVLSVPELRDFVGRGGPFDVDQDTPGNCDVWWAWPNRDRVFAEVVTKTYTAYHSDYPVDLAAEHHREFCAANERIANGACVSERTRTGDDAPSLQWKTTLRVRESNRTVVITLKADRRAALDDAVLEGVARAVRVGGAVQ